MALSLGLTRHSFLPGKAAASDIPWLRAGTDSHGQEIWRRRIEHRGQEIRISVHLDPASGSARTIFAGPARGGTPLTIPGSLRREVDAFVLSLGRP